MFYVACVPSGDGCVPRGLWLVKNRIIEAVVSMETARVKVNDTSDSQSPSGFFKRRFRGTFL